MTGLAAVLFFCGCSRNEAVNDSEILTLPAVRGSAANHVTFIGNVTGGQTTSLTWKTSGVISAVNVKIGDQVAVGQLMAELGREFLPADVITAEVPYIEALDQLDEVLSSETPKAQAYKDLKDKEAALENAEKYRESLKYPHAVLGDVLYWADQVEKSRDLYEEALQTMNDAVSWKNSPVKFERDTYESLRKNMLTAMNNYAETYNTYLYYRGSADENEKARASADINVAKADYEKALTVFKTYAKYPREKDVSNAQLTVENARDTYDRRNITAPVNGTVTQINAEPGKYVTQGTPAFRLDNTDELYVPMNISEIDILSVHDGMKAEIVLDANPSKTYEGVVSTVSATGETSGSQVTFQAMVKFLEPDDSVKIGMTAEVKLITETLNDSLLVPANAVYYVGNTAYVGISNGTACYDTPVTVTLTTETIAAITGGFLKEGDPVCVPSVDDRILEAMGLSGEKNNQVLLIAPPAVQTPAVQ